MARAIKIFWENDFSNVQANALQRVKARIDQENQNYLLNVNEEDYLAHIVSEFRIEPLSIDFGGVEASFSEKMIQAERFPQTFHVFAGKSYPRQVVRYHIPFSGDPRLLQCVPSPRVMNTFQVEVESDAICFVSLRQACVTRGSLRC